jgi:SulP family sulfate permease
MKNASGWHRRIWQVVRSLAANSGLRWFPLAPTLRDYSKAKLLQDARAGLNVALLAFPQAMAYALIAGLPVQFGLYGAAVAGLIAPFFSSSRYVMVGPTNATAVMVLSAFMSLPFGSERAEYIGIFLLMVGIFLTVGSFFRVASLVQYVSQTVVTAYITGAAVLIIANQVPAALGFRLEGASTFIEVVVETVRHIGQTQWPSLMLGLGTAGAYVVFQRKFKALPSVAVTLLVMSLVGCLMQAAGLPLVFLNKLPLGAWKASMPVFDPQAISLLASSALAVAFLCVVETTSVGKSLANRVGERIDPNQEMLGLGISNTACAFFGGMPASGSVTRSVLNFASGARTPVASWICALLIAVGALGLGPLIGFIPKAVLAVLVIMVGVALINRRQIRYAYNSTNSDRITFLVTLASALVFSLDFAIYLGVAVSIILFLRKASAPTLVEYSFNDEGHLYQIETKDTRAHPSISIVHVEGELFFGAAELFREQIRLVSEDPSLKVIILRLKNAYHLDATSVMALEELIRHLREQGRHLIVSGARKEVYRVFRKSGLIDILGKENFFMGSPANPNVSTRNALKRAQALLGDVKADVKIYYDPAKAEPKSRA